MSARSTYASFLGHAWRLLLGLCCLAGSVTARADYSVTVPSYKGRPGMTVRVPVTLNNAAEVAGILIRINYSPQIVTVLGVSSGGLGSQFTLSHSAVDGVLTVMATRSTNLISGSGTVVILDLEVNDGAQDGDFSELTLAQFDLSDDTGVQRPSWINMLTLGSGRLTARTTGIIDNDADLLPDDWEASNSLDTLVSNYAGDEDGDGLNNFTEYAFGKNPRISDGSPTFAGSVLIDGRQYLTVSYRRQSYGVSYAVEESANLFQWTLVDPVSNRVGSVLDHGDGTQTWQVRGTLPFSGTGSVPRGFLRVKATASE